jgi:hypothetical protein
LSKDIILGFKTGVGFKESLKLCIAPQSSIQLSISAWFMMQLAATDSLYVDPKILDAWLDSIKIKAFEIRGQVSLSIAKRLLDLADRNTEEIRNLENVSSALTGECLCY